jgi:hypothetical protein
MEIPKTDIGGRIEGQSLLELREGLPDEAGRGNQWRVLFWAK